MAGGFHPLPKNPQDLTVEDMRAAFGGLNTPAGQSALRRIARVCCGIEPVLSHSQPTTPSEANERAPKTA